MIADFPKIKNKLDDMADKLLQGSIKKHAPFLNMVGKRMIFEGEELNYVRENGEKTSMTFKASEQSFSLTREELSKMSLFEILQKVDELGKKIAGDMERDMLTEINTSVQKNGNILEGNPSLNEESLLLAMSKIDMSFIDDDINKPVMPTIVAAPGAVDSLMEAEKKSTDEQKADFKRRQQEIISQKYEKYIEDVNSRYLTD